MKALRAIGVVLALLFGLVIGPTTTATAVTKPSSLSVSALRTRLVYYQGYGRGIEKQLALKALNGKASFEAKKWRSFLSSWDKAVTSQKLYYSTPTNLPKSGHVFVVLGAGGDKLERRVALAKQALDAYPNSKVLLTGGVPRANGDTEADIMKASLTAQGIASSRILLERAASSTVGNAKNSMAILRAHPELTSYTLISDASHIRRATVLFLAASTKIQYDTKTNWRIRPVANLAFSDSTVSAAANTSTRTYIASNVASVLGVSSAFTSTTRKPPARANLIKISVKSKSHYQVGTRLTRSKLTVTAKFDQGNLNVASVAKVTGFSAPKVGTRKVSVSYRFRGVTKKATFKLKIVKASTKVSVRLSSTSTNRKKARLKVAVHVTSATGIRAGGKLAFYANGKLVKTVTLKAGKASFCFPKFKGVKTLQVVYAGNAKLKSAKKTFKSASFVK
jgi:uncharacterized SAM-binding protein YcdF (DUF218 family)